MPYGYDEKGNQVYIPNEPKTDFSELLISVNGSRGEKNYQKVAHRIQQFRERYPEGEITTELISEGPWDNTHRAIFRCHITAPDGAEATGYGSETLADFRDYIEKAESKAIGRALNAIGIGVNYDYSDHEYEAESRKEFTGVDGVTKNATASKPAKTPAKQTVEVKPELTNLNRQELLDLTDREQDRLGRPATQMMLEYARANFDGRTRRTELTDAELVQLLSWLATQDPQAA